MQFAQLEFNFDELPKESIAEKQNFSLPYFDIPKCDNERLLNYQYEYKEQGNKSALNSMYTLGYTIALKYIIAKAKKNRRVAMLCTSDREEKAHNAITYIIEQYIKRPDFSIRTSFTSYLYYRILHELFYKRKVDEIVSFVDMETFFYLKKIE